jgi:hypothetical protein
MPTRGGDVPVTSDPVARKIHQVNMTQPSIARVYDYLLDGKDNFAVDRAVAEKLMASDMEPKRLALVQRDFLVRAVQFVTAQGVAQFLDLGSGLPTSPSVHEIARGVIPDARVAYVDNDPIVHMHNQAELAIDDGVATAGADVRDPEAVLGSKAVQGCLDFSQPVGILLVGIVHFLGDEDDVEGMISRYRDAVPAGSYLVLSTGTTEKADSDLISDTKSAYRDYSAPFRLRSRAEILRLFDGFDLIDPGLVSMPEWRPTEATDRVPLKATSLGGIAVKP